MRKAERRGFWCRNSFGPGGIRSGPPTTATTDGVWYDYAPGFRGQGYALIMYSNGPMTSHGTALKTAGSGPRFVVAEREQLQGRERIARGSSSRKHPNR